MQKVVIKSVEEKHSKDGSKTFYIVTDITGAQMSSFASEVMSLKPGTEIAGEIELSGKYANLKEFKIVNEPKFKESPKSQYIPRTESPDARRSIERQVAVKLAFEFGINGDDDVWTLGKVLKQAEQIYQWIAEGKFPPGDTKPMGSPQKEAIKIEDKVKSPQEDKQPPPDAKAMSESPVLIDMVWLKESLEKLGWTTVLVYLQKKYQVSGNKVSEVILLMTKEQQQEFAHEVQQRLAVAEK